MKVSVVHPSVKFSNEISSEGVRPDSFHISQIASIGRGNEKLSFCFNRIRTRIAMATYSSHRLIVGRVDFFLSHWGYFDFFFQKCLLSSPLRVI